MQYFKGDTDELKMVASALPVLNVLSSDKDAFFDGAYQTGPLGDLIYDSNRAPLSTAIVQGIFRDTFYQIFESFISAGTFESYIDVFKKIFGDDVSITFTVPGPGQLTIAIVATSIETSPFVAREIVSEVYEFSNVVTQAGDQIVFQTIKGFQSQYELEQMLFEMVPAGIFTTINLTIGGP